jgi:hypothetical protein
VVEAVVAVADVAVAARREAEAAVLAEVPLLQPALSEVRPQTFRLCRIRISLHLLLMQARRAVPVDVELRRVLQQPVVEAVVVAVADVVRVRLPRQQPLRVRR